MAVRSWIEANNFRRGKAVLRFSDMPEAYTCYNFTPGGSASVTLTPQGARKFSDPSAMNSAISSAISGAFGDFSSKAGTYCVGEKCFSASGFHSATVSGNVASCQISAGQQYEQWDALCDPLGLSPDGGGGGVFDLNISGPGPIGVDLQPLLESINPDAVTLMPGIYGDALRKWVADSIETQLLVIVPSFATSVSVALQPDGYPHAGTVTVDRYIHSGSSGSKTVMRFIIIIPSNVPGVGNTYGWTITALFVWTSGDFTPGNTMSASGYYDDPYQNPFVTWGVNPSDFQIAPGILPSSWSLKNENSPITVSITGVPYIYPSGVWEWAFDTVGVAGGGDYLTGSGSFGLNPVLEFPVVYNTPDCMVNLYYIARHDFLAKKSIMCETIFELEITPDTIWPKNHTPVCTIPVIGINYTPPV